MPRFSVPTTTQGQRIGDYVLGKSFHKGACSKVRVAKHVLTGRKVVVKTIFQRDVDVSSSSQELHCLRTLQHRNISRLLEVVVAPKEVHLVMEYVRGGDLKQYLERRGRLTERQARVVFRQVFLGLHLCHRRGYAHLDIKPDNILLEEDLTAKLADFGLSHKATELLTCWCGTLYYMAPEVLRGGLFDGLKADVWGLGVSLYQAVTGRVPFPACSQESIMELIVGGHYQPPYYMSEAGRSFIQSLLTVDPEERPTLEEAMRLPWLQLGPEELLTNSELPGEELDPQVLKAMCRMGFEEEVIRDSVAGQTFDRVMGTYRILLMTMGRMGMGRMPGRTIKVRPYRPPDTGAGPPSSREESPATGGSSGPSVASPPCPRAKKTSAPPPSRETIAASPLPLEPVQALQPEGSPRPSVPRSPYLRGVKNTCAPPPPPPSLETIASSPLPLEPVQALQPEGSPRPSLPRSPYLRGVKNTYAPPPPPPPPSLEDIASSPLPLEPVQALQPEGSPRPSVPRSPYLRGVKNTCAPPPPPPSLETIASSPLPLEPVQALQPEGSPRPSLPRSPYLRGVKNTYAPPPPPPPPSLQAIASSPLPLEPVRALQPGTRGPAPQLRPGGAPTPRTSNRFRGPESQAVQDENPEGAPPVSSRQEGSPPASPAANTRARPGLVQRAWKTFLKVFCCGVDTTKPRRKTTRARSGNT